MAFLYVSLWLCAVFCTSNVFVHAEKCRPIPLSDAKLAAEASYHVYGDKVKLPVGDVIPGTKFRVVNSISPVIGGNTLRAIVATHEKTTIICFRGTTGISQLIQQFQSAVAPAKLLLYKGRAMYVLTFFWDALMKFKPESLVPGGIKKGQKYILTGHSLGGALASLYAIYVKIMEKGLWEHKESSLITFGQPRVGNPSYAELHDELISPNRKLRFINQQDLVPHIPLKIWYTHHSREVWIWKQSIFGHYVKNWSMCKLGDDPDDCSADDKSMKEPFSHDILKYRNEIFKTPDVFLDKDEKSYLSFEEIQCR